MKSLFRLIAITVLGIGCQLAEAQNVRYAGAQPTSFGNVNLGASNTLDRQISVALPADNSRISELTVTGSGFSLTGGTCAVGAVVTSGTPCTLQLRFAPGSAGAALGNLFINCSTSLPVGGVSIICGTGGNIGLVGNGIGALLAALPVPALGPAALTALSLMLVAGTLLTLRRKRKG